MELPKHGMETREVMKFMREFTPPDWVPHILYDKQVAVVNSSDNRLAIFGLASSGKTTSIVLSAYKYIIDERHKIASLLKQELLSENLPNNIVEDFVRKLFKYKRLTTKYGQPLRLDDKHSIKWSTLCKLSDRGIIEDVKKQGRDVGVKLASRPQVIFVCGCEVGRVKAQQMFESFSGIYNELYNIVVSDTVTANADVLLMAADDVEKLTKSELWKLKEVGFVIVDDIHMIKNIYYFKRSYLRLVEYLESDHAIKRFITCTDVLNPKDVADYFLGKGNTIVTFKGRLGTARIIPLREPYERGLTEKCTEIAKEYMNQNKNVLVIAAPYDAIQLENALKKYGGNFEVVNKANISTFKKSPTAVVLCGYSAPLPMVIDIALMSISKPLEIVDITYITRDRALDRYISNNIEKRGLFIPITRESESAELLSVLSVVPLTEQAATKYSSRAVSILSRLREKGLVTKEGRYWKATDSGNKSVYKKESVSVVSRGRIICEKEKSIYSKTFEGHSIQIDGVRYEVLSLDEANNKLNVRPISGKKNTYDVVIPRVDVNIVKRLREVQRIKKVRQFLVALDLTFKEKLCVTKKVTADAAKPHTVIKARYEEQNRQFKMETIGIVLEAPVSRKKPKKVTLKKYWNDFKVAPELHSLSHALISAIKILLDAKQDDVCEYCDDDKLILYANNLAGYGLLEAASNRFGDLLEIAKKLLENCHRGCKLYCPACSVIPNCNYGNIWLSRDGAVRLLQ